jgi:hypothetical protein
MEEKMDKKKITMEEVYEKLGALSSEVIPETPEHVQHMKELRETAIGITRKSHEETKKKKKMAKKSRQINRRK